MSHLTTGLLSHLPMEAPRQVPEPWLTGCSLPSLHSRNFPD